MIVSTGVYDATAALGNSSEGRWPRIYELCRPRAGVLRVAMLSLHTSPLAALGRSRDAGGMNVYVRELARHLGACQIAVDVFTRWTDAAMPQIVALGDHARLIHLPVGPIAPLHKNDLFPYTGEFAASIMDFASHEGAQYDIVHSHYWLSGVAGMQLAQTWQVPHVVMFHTLARLKQQARPAEQETEQRSEYERRIIQTADDIIVATADEQEQILKLYHTAEHTMHIVPGGVDLDFFTPGDRVAARQELQSRLGIDAAPLILFVGRLDPLKGPDLLVEMMALLRTEAQLVLVGGNEQDPERGRLLALAQSCGVAQRVHLVDAVAQSSLPEFYRAADLVAIASYYESFGLVAAEALACGTPVVAPRVGGLPVIVQDGVNGVLIGKRSPMAFAGHVDALLGDPARMARLAAAARPSVQRFDWHVIAAAIATRYRALTLQGLAAAAGG